MSASCQITTLTSLSTHTSVAVDLRPGKATWHSEPAFYDLGPDYFLSLHSGSLILLGLFKGEGDCCFNLIFSQFLLWLFSVFLRGLLGSSIISSDVFVDICASGLDELTGSGTLFQNRALTFLLLLDDLIIAVYVFVINSFGGNKFGRVLSVVP